MTDAAPVAPTPLPTRVRAYSSARADGQPKLFSVDGETFACLPKVPGVLTLDAAKRFDAAGGTGELGQGLAALGMISDFFEAVLLRDDAGEHGDSSSYDRFMARIRDHERIIDGETVGAIYRDLMEDYTGRPTVPGSRSAG